MIKNQKKKDPEFCRVKKEKDEIQYSIGIKSNLNESFD